MSEPEKQIIIIFAVIGACIAVLAGIGLLGLWVIRKYVQKKSKK